MKQTLAATLRQQLLKRERASAKLGREMATLRDALYNMEALERRNRATEARNRRSAKRKRKAAARHA